MISSAKFDGLAVHKLKHVVCRRQAESITVFLKKNRSSKLNKLLSDHV